MVGKAGLAVTVVELVKPWARVSVKALVCHSLPPVLAGMVLGLSDSSGSMVAERSCVLAAPAVSSVGRTVIIT